MSRDPFIDLRAVPEELLRPIRPWVDAHLAARYERHFTWRGLQLSVETGSLVKASTLTGVFSEFTRLAAAAEKTAKQQAAQIEAECGLGVAKARADNLKDRLMRAVEAQAVAARQVGDLKGDKEVLTRDVTALREAGRKQAADAQALTTARHAAEGRAQQIANDRDTLGSAVQRLLSEQKAADQRINDLAREGDNLASQLQQATANKQVYLGTIADLRRRLDDRARLEAEIAARARRVLAHSEALDQQVQALTAQVEKLEAEADTLDAKAQELSAQRQGLADENRRWKAQAQGEARAAARQRAQNAALKAENTNLAADREALAAEVQALRVIEQRLRDDIRRWRAQAGGETRPTARDRAWTAGLLAARWMRSRCAA